MKNLAANYTDLKSFIGSFQPSDDSSGTAATPKTTTTTTTTGAASGTTGTAGTTGSTTGTTTTTTAATVAGQVSNLLVPTTSEILWGIVSGDILSTSWQKLTSNTGSLLSIGFKQVAEITGTPFKQILNFIGGGATYVCYVNGSQVSFTTAIKYPVIAGGVAARQETTGSIKTMVQLMPLKIDRVGAARCCRAAPAMRWPTTHRSTCVQGPVLPHQAQLRQHRRIQAHRWYDNFGCAAGKKVRVIIAVKND
mgnify:CR=1 FL=1